MKGTIVVRMDDGAIMVYEGEIEKYSVDIMVPDGTDDADMLEVAKKTGKQALHLLLPEGKYLLHISS